MTEDTVVDFQPGDESEDPVMPDPDDVVPGAVEEEAIIGPQPTGADEVETGAPASETTSVADPAEPVAPAEAPDADETQPPAEPATTTTPTWNKEQQRVDEADAAKGESKAAITTERDALALEVTRLETEMAAIPRPTGAGLEPLSEVDSFGEPDEVNIERNRREAAMQAQIDATNARIATLADDKEQTDNEQAFDRLMNAACKGNEAMRNPLHTQVYARWENLGYERGYYPSPTEAGLLIEAEAGKLANAQLRAQNTQLTTKAQVTGPASDTGKGGHATGTKMAIPIESTMAQTVKRMQSEGKFKDVT